MDLKQRADLVRGFRLEMKLERAKTKPYDVIGNPIRGATMTPEESRRAASLRNYYEKPQGDDLHRQWHKPEGSREFGIYKETTVSRRTKPGKLPNQKVGNFTRSTRWKIGMRDVSGQEKRRLVSRTVPDKDGMNRTAMGFMGASDYDKARMSSRVGVMRDGKIRPTLLSPRQNRALTQHVNSQADRMNKPLLDQLMAERRAKQPRDTRILRAPSKRPNY